MPSCCCHPIPFERLPVPAIEGVGLNPSAAGYRPGDPSGDALCRLCRPVRFAFSLAMGALLTNQVNPSFARVLRPWVLGAWVLLTFGITAWFLLGLL